jgi:deazaflavin-dependent oxidoreductase (nitroreductase family)
LAYTLGLGSLVGHFVLLLKTTGRKSGIPRVTPLQYQEINGVIYVASARGVKADWYRNLAANPNVEVTIGSRRIKGRADLITDPGQIADFLELRLKRHPRMVGAMLKLEGLSPTPTREQLEQYAKNLLGIPVGISNVEEIDSQLISPTKHSLVFFDVFLSIHTAQGIAAYAYFRYSETVVFSILHSLSPPRGPQWSESERASGLRNGCASSQRDSQAHLLYSAGAP